jgi:hypothetical protein
MKLSSLLLCAGVVLANAAPAGAQQTTTPAQPAAATPVTGATVALLPPSKQGPAGSAQIAQQGTDVVITIHGMQDQTTAAILSGRCTGTSKPDVAGPAQALKPLVNGSSQTVVPNTTVAQLASTPHAIVVQGGATPTLCGDVSVVTAQPPQ